LSIWAIIFYAVFVLAVLIGLPSKKIIAAFLLNLIASFFLKETPTAIAIADLAAAAYLFGQGSKENLIAALFGCMVLLYWVPTGFPQVQISEIYVMVEIIAYIQLMVIGYGGGGIAFIRRHIGLRWPFVLGALAARRNPALGFSAGAGKGLAGAALVSEKGER
jgi:hypothetical protein